MNSIRYLHLSRTVPQGILVFFILTAMVSLSAQTADDAPRQAMTSASAEINFAELAKQQAQQPEAPQQQTVVPIMRGPRLQLPANLVGSPAAPEFTVAEALGTLSPLLSRNFQGATDNGVFIPPDTQGAVGPDHLVVTVNGTFLIQNRVGGAVSSVTLNAFWAAVGGSPVTFDPKIVYDPFNGRWITCAAANPQTSTSALLIGVSQTSDPTGTWFLYKINVSLIFPPGISPAVWADYPSLGFNQNWIAFSWNAFTVSGNQYQAGVVSLFDKANLYTGPAGASSNSFSRNDVFTLTPAVTYDNTLATLYLLETINGNAGGGKGAMRLSSMTGPVGTPVFNVGLGPDPQGQTLSPDNTAWEFCGGPPTCPDFAPQSGVASKINTGDDRVLKLAYRNGHLWASHTVFLPTGTPTRSAVQWWELDTSASNVGKILQFGRIDDPTGNIFRAYPTLAVNQNEDMLVGYSIFSSSTFASAAYSFRTATDPVNTLQSEASLKAGTAAYFKDFGSGSNRWGDYSNTVVDPLNDLDMWTIQEYAAATNTWGTWWGEIMLSAPPATHFQVTAPGMVGAGSAFSVTVTALDATNATVTGYVGTVHFSAPGAATVPADYTFVTGDNGVHTFANGFILNTAGTQTITATDTANNTITGNKMIAVVAPPAITKSFGAPTIPLNGTTLLTVSISNPNTSVALSGIAFTDSLPAGLVVSAPNNLSSNCAATTTAVAGSSSVSFSGGTLAASASCTVSVNVTGTTAGTKNNSVMVTAAESGNNPSPGTAALIVINPLTIGKAFGTSTVPLNGSTSLTFTLTNPVVNSIALTGVAFTDNLPTGLAVASTPDLNNTCGGAATAAGGASSVGLSGGTLASGASCTVSVQVTATTAGAKNNTVQATSTQGGASNAASATVVVIGFGFVPVAPCRVADTRNPAGPFGGPFLSGGTTRGFAIPTSSCGIPSTAQAYSINVTVVPKVKLGFLTMFPCGQALPLASTLNSIDGRIKAGAAIIPAGTNGAVCAFPTDDTDLIIDINGYFVAATNTTTPLAFYPLTPCRLVDTRGPVGALGGPALVGNAARTFPILSSSCNVPNTAQAYSMNFTSVPKGKLGFLTTWPAGQTQPLVSTLNAPTGTVTANAAIVPAGTNGDISVFVTDDSNLVVDINGYFAPPGQGGLSLFPLTPCRILDTRNPAGSPPFSGTIKVNVTASGCGAPASAQSYILNGTVVPPGPLGFLTLWPQGTAQPLVSTLNAGDAAVTSNMAIVPTMNGSISAFASDPTHLVLDISGYFAP